MTPLRRRLAVLAAFAALLAGPGAGLASAQSVTTQSTDAWLCSSLWPVAGLCLDSPLRWVDDVVGGPTGH